MARRPRPPLDVHLNGRILGQVRRSASGAIDFRYDQSWLVWTRAIPVSFSLPLREDRYIGAPVLAVFENLLPDSPDIRRRVAERSHAEGSDAYSLLAAIGRDCVGALQFVPAGVELAPTGSIDARPVSDEEIAAILGDLAQSPLGIGNDEEFRISLAGAQEKTALLRVDGSWRVPHGTTATTHIIKPEIGVLRNGIDLSQSVENEYLCLKIVGALGLPVTNAEMAQFGGRKALVVERFDRRWTGDGRLLRLPQEDCCQALSVPPNLKYEIRRRARHRKDRRTAEGKRHTRRGPRPLLQGANGVLAARRDRSPRQEFQHPSCAGGRFRLAPLYDVMSTQPNVDADQIRRNKMRMAMAVGTKRHYVVDSITARHYAQTAARCGFPTRNLARLIDELQDTTGAAIDQTVAGLPANFPEALAASIADAAKARLHLLKLVEE